MPPTRQELLAWMNNLLQLNITRVEQCGTGYDAPLDHSPPMERAKPMSGCVLKVESRLTYLEPLGPHYVKSTIASSVRRYARHLDELSFTDLFRGPTNVQSKIQREHRIPLPSEFQNPSKYHSPPPFSVQTTRPRKLTIQPHRLFY